ncbi:hypothetical protein DFH08DRAFT_830806 [Mycena albidolilacea]|uniref:WIBG Mago-binding domain-containing protein n=1 Tax=Mycena albidolilacea TaxID=1033008 RepID=A0AAD7AUC7_9AGAR|nr:hypothetical protein DFH08DRAFT_830806 [Mycena albidolilacea]
MSLPPINPDKTVAGIALDPQTLERVIPESKRPDGTVRKQIKIRPGFTPQEDVRRFRGTKQAQQDANALPKGHIIGWAPPPTSQASGSVAKPMSKSAKKNAKRREKKEVVAENWEDDDEAPGTAAGTASRDSAGAAQEKKAPRSSSGSVHTPEKPNWADAPDEAALAAKLEKLDVK